MAIKDFMNELNAMFNGAQGQQGQQGGQGQAAPGAGGAQGAAGGQSAAGGQGSVFTMDGRQVHTRQERKPRPPRGTPASRTIISLIITLVFGFVWFWFKLPALNIHEFGFWGMLFWMCVVFAACMLFLRGSGEPIGNHPIKYFKSNVKVPFYIIVAIVVIVVLGYVAGMTIFRAHAYAKLLPVEDGDFAEEVAEISWSQIPMLDADSANTLTNRKLGELSDLVSQFTVNTNSSQINYQDIPVRVTFLDYGNIFKWLNNIRSGIPAYMYVDMRTQEVTVVRLDDGIKYCPSDYLIRDIHRYLRFTHPFTLFDDVNFEVDDDGTPYWVASVISRKIGLFGGRDAKGAVLVNAVNGDSQYFDLADVPTWVDRVFSAEMCMEQYDYYGTYIHGFWNSLFGQSDCRVTTDGYNYIAQNDDIYLYSGITSISGDRGNIGFILINQRTKEARYYSCAGADETSAMSSAEGAVQQYSYDATFPLLLNINDQPTYFMALKDASSLVKMYAMVNVQQYQIVAIGTNLQHCQANYETLLANNGISSSKKSDGDEGSADAAASAAGTITGAIVEIRSATMSGETVYFIKVEGSDSYYTITASAYPQSVILDVGDTVTITFEAGASGSIITGTSLS